MVRTIKGRYHLQVLVGHACNARCEHCDKAVGYADFNDLNFTPEMMREAVTRCNDERVKVTRLTLSGGEPILNARLQEIIDEADKLKWLTLGRVLSNGMTVTEDRRSRIAFPSDVWQWAISTLDDPNDYKSGKNNHGVRYRNHVHLPYWISPADVGEEARFKWCTVRNFCGRGLDAGGFSMCGQAPILGRLLGINPYRSGTVREQMDTPVAEICKHCIYGCKTKAAARELADRAVRGEIDSISPTFKAAFERDPVELVELKIV